MKKIKDNIKSILVACLCFALIGVFVLMDRIGTTQASTPGGLSTATSTTQTVVIGSTTPVTIATQAVNNNCSATIIKTGPRDMFFTIGSSTVAAPVVNGAGLLQLSSTTVAYNSETYGCATWQAVSYETSSSNASTTITITRTY